MSYKEGAIELGSTFSRRQVEVIAGLSAGFSTTIIMHPLDLIKIRLQLAVANNQIRMSPFGSITLMIRSINSDALVSYRRSMFEELQLSRNGKSTTIPAPTGKTSPEALSNSMHNSISNKVHIKIPTVLNSLSYRLHLLRHFYRGLTPNLVGNISAWGLYFSLYAEFKSVIQTSNASINYFTSSTLAGLSTSVLTNPIWVLKTRILGTSSNEGRAYRSLVDGIRTMLRAEGVTSFWKGTIPSMFLVFQGSLQFTFYDHAKSYMLSQQDSQHLSTAQYIIASATSKTLSMMIMYPTQVIKSRMQYFQENKGRVTISSVIKHLWSTQSWRGFYNGLTANVIRVVPSTCITFVVYEKAKIHLQGL